MPVKVTSLAPSVTLSSPTVTSVRSPSTAVSLNSTLSSAGAASEVLPLSSVVMICLVIWIESFGASFTIRLPFSSSSTSPVVTALRLTISPFSIVKVNVETTL